MKVRGNPFGPVQARVMHENCSDDKVALFQEVDMALAFRSAMASNGKSPSITTLVVRAVSEALGAHPCANRLLLKTIWGWRKVQLDTVDVSVGSKSGLVVP